MSKDNKHEAKHQAQVNKSPEQEVLPLSVTAGKEQISEKTKAEMEAGRKAVAEAEERETKTKLKNST